MCWVRATRYKVNTIFEQSPVAGSKIPANKSVSVRIFGGLATKGPAPPPDQLEQMIPGSDRQWWIAHMGA